MQVRGFGARGGPSALNEYGLEPGGSPAQASRPALAGTFVIARTQASPGAQMCSAGEPAHVGANLRQDDLGAQFTAPHEPAAPALIPTEQPRPPSRSTRRPP